MGCPNSTLSVGGKATKPFVSAPASLNPALGLSHLRCPVPTHSLFCVPGHLSSLDPSTQGLQPPGDFGVAGILLVPATLIPVYRTCSPATFGTPSVSEVTRVGYWSVEARPGPSRHKGLLGGLGLLSWWEGEELVWDQTVPKISSRERRAQGTSEQVWMLRTEVLTGKRQEPGV